MSHSTSGPDLFNRLADEFAERYRRGERPTVSEYAEKHPELAAQIHELFPALVAMEQFGSGANQTSEPAAPRPETVGPIPERLGDYRILREIARGGMGIVYEAVQESLGRHVALKVLPQYRLHDPNQLERFQREARAAAMLHHTNIVPVFGVGEHNGVHYYAMQYIQGQGLDAVLREVKQLRGFTTAQPATSFVAGGDLASAASVAIELVSGRFAGPSGALAETVSVAESRPPPPGKDSATTPLGVGPGPSSSASSIVGQSGSPYYRSVARLGVQVAEALAYAHHHKLLHRDIKPSNLLLDLQGTIWVTDFGLVKAEGTDALTQTGDIVGTLRYMAPERFRGQGDARSDVYALGLTLYEMLTLEPAFAADQRSVLIDKILHEEPSKPRQIDPRIPSDLETIALKAIAKEPGDRYATASQLAEDLRRFAAGRPILARRARISERAVKWARRRPAIAALLGLVALATATGLGGVLWQWCAAVTARLDAERESGRAKVQTELAEQARRAEAAQRAVAKAGEQRALEEKRIAEAVRTFLQRDLLEQANPAEQAEAVWRAGGGFETIENPTIKELLDRAASQLTPGKIEEKFPGQLEVQASILKTVGTTYCGIGEFAKGVEFLTRSSEAYSHTLGANHADTLTCLDNLARACLWAGKTVEAVNLFEQVRDARVKILGAGQPETLSTLHGLGEAYLSAGKGGEAVALYERLRDACVKKLGPEHPQTLFTLHGLAAAYFSAGKTAEALALLVHLRETCVRKLGADHPQSLAALHDLAQTYRAAGKTAEAIALYEQVRDASVKKIGADHPFTLAALDNLAGAYLLAGRTSEAVALFQQVRAARVKKLGAHHASTFISLNNLAEAYRAAGKTDEAIALFEQVRDARVKSLGSDHPQTLATFAGLGGAYQAAGKPERALPLLQQAAAGIEKRRFVDFHAGQIVSVLIGCHEQLEQYDQAEAWRRKWLAVVKERAGPESLPYAGELAVLGASLLQQKKWVDAEPVLRECLALREHKEPDSWTTFNARSMLGEALNGQNKPAEAEPLLVQGYEGLTQRAEKIPKEGKHRLAESLERLVQLYEATGKKDKAKAWQKKLAEAKAPAKPASKP